MADEKKPTAPAVGGTQTAQIKLPENMTADQFQKLFSTFMSQRIATKARDTAVRSALTDLAKMHPGDYEALLKKHGYTPKVVRV